MLKSESDPALRRFAARKLQETSVWTESEAEILVDSLKDSDLGVKDICALALSEAKHQKAKIAASKILPLLKSESLELRILAAEIIEKIGIPASEFVVKLLDDVNPATRKIALDILSKIKDPKSMDFIAKRLEDDIDNIVSSAIEALGNIKAIKYSKEIISYYYKNEDYKLYVIEALGKIGGIDAIIFLKNLLVTESYLILKTAVIDALSYCTNDNESVELLLEEFPKAIPSARGSILKAIMAISSRSGTPRDFEGKKRDLCVECLKDDEADIRAAALLALGGIYKVEEIDIIFNQFTIESKELQRYLLLNILANNSGDFVNKFFETAFKKDNSGDLINDILDILPFVFPTAGEENAKIALGIIADKAVSEQISFYKEIYDTIIQLDYNIALERLKQDIQSNEKLVVESAIEVVIAYNLKDLLQNIINIKNNGVLSESFIDDAILRLSW